MELYDVIQCKNLSGFDIALIFRKMTQFPIHTKCIDYLTDYLIGYGFSSLTAIDLTQIIHSMAKMKYKSQLLRSVTKLRR
jgi:hypothetical protein